MARHLLVLGHGLIELRQVGVVGGDVEADDGSHGGVGILVEELLRLLDVALQVERAGAGLLAELELLELLHVPVVLEGRPLDLLHELRILQVLVALGVVEHLGGELHVAGLYAVVDVEGRSGEYHHRQQHRYGTVVVLEELGRPLCE
ncbi:MAG: hypothetical protein DRP90_00240 [Planctomycetota bacterium]|nr:MAG: hypothetical protein DRP90_00240 [Planctomycetota bacterium]